MAGPLPVWPPNPATIGVAANGALLPARSTINIKSHLTAVDDPGQGTTDVSPDASVGIGATDPVTGAVALGAPGGTPLATSAVAGGAATFGRADRALPLFAGDGEVGVQLRQIAQGDTMAAIELLRKVKGEVYEVARLRELGSQLPGGYTLQQLDARELAAPMKSIAWGNLTADGGAMAATASTYSYGGQYYSTTTANRGVHTTLPAGTVRIGIGTAMRANGSLQRVGLSTDGGVTYNWGLANMLPTAQQLVNWGVAPNTILVANGGPFAPTDNVLDLEPAAWYNSGVGATNDVFNFHILLADGLDPTQTWTVKIVMTSFKNLANPNTATLYGERITYGKQGFTTDTAGSELLPIRRAWHTYKSAMEYALSVQPNGTTQFNLVGNVHGYDSQQSLTVWVDGELVTLPAFTPAQPPVAVFGREVVLVRTSQLFHPQNGATPWATMVTVYRVTRDGLMITPQLTDSIAATLAEAYASMLPLEGRTLSTGWHAADTSERTWLAGDNSRTTEYTDGMVFWDPTRSFACLWTVPDVRRSLQGYPAPITGQYVGAQDTAPSSSSGAPNSKSTKGYASRSQGAATEAIALNEVINLGEARHALALTLQPEAVLGWGN
jgi:hypothetical protein